jgi:hypothetical protein
MNKMPYQIISTPEGYKVALIADPSRTFSVRGLPYKKALKQLRALQINAT